MSNTKQQPEALRLADAYEATGLRGHAEVATELRRLQAETEVIRHNNTRIARRLERTSDALMDARATNAELLVALKRVMKLAEEHGSKDWQEAENAGWRGMTRGADIRTSPPINALDFGVPGEFSERAESYARWAVAMERDACAKVADSGLDPRPVTDPDRYLPGAKEASRYTAGAIAAAIRARGAEIGKTQ